MDQSMQSLTFCGRCSREFDGGPGRPFCDLCAEAMSRENGATEEDIQALRQKQAQQQGGMQPPHGQPPAPGNFQTL